MFYGVFWVQQFSSTKSVSNSYPGMQANGKAWVKEKTQQREEMAFDEFTGSSVYVLVGKQKI